MSETSDEEIEAKALVERIRAQHSFEGNEGLAVQIQALLHMTASEFYDVATHFLLELLQNADDNEYHQTTIPSLVFTYEPGGLRVDCNETGFEAKHVRGISQVRSSTKSRQDNSHNYTGEKGIGFKSVFRVADEVWISSRQYCFKFDKAELFGMIAPRWAEFPRPTHREQTSFYLKLSKECKEDELVEHLRDFDPRLLLFLKRIQNVTVRILQSPEETLWEKTILKSTKDTDDAQNATAERPLTVIQTRDGQLRYLTLEYQIENLPVEPRRPNCPSTKIVLAFPVTDFPEQPQQECHNVYATLPISDHGLEFPIQADFILSANRLHIDVSLAWNEAIRDGLAHAFVQAVRQFVRGSMKYYWPYFIPPQDVSSFFQPLRIAILRELRESEAVESFVGNLLQPSTLLYVRNELKDKDGRPFTLSSETENKYLSGMFPTPTISNLLDLGVQHLTDELFLSDLGSMISLAPTDFHERSADWHAQLSDTLVTMVDSPEKREIIAKLTIVPLEGGGWARADQHPVMMSEKLIATTFPVDHAIQIIDSTAARDTRRRRLYDRLGILELDTPRMCRLIADLHESPSFDPAMLSPDQLISHVKFLFDASWQPPHGVKLDLWFATADGGRCKGSLLYLPTDFPRSSSTAKVFDMLKQKFAVIHEDYTFTKTPDFFPDNDEITNLSSRLKSYTRNGYGDNVSFISHLRNPVRDPFARRSRAKDRTAFLFECCDDIQLHKSTEPQPPSRTNREPSLDIQFSTDGSTMQVSKTYPNDLPVIDHDFLKYLAPTVLSDIGISSQLSHGTFHKILIRCIRRMYTALA